MASLYGPCAPTPPSALIQTEPPAHVARGLTEQGLGGSSAGARGKSPDYPVSENKAPMAVVAVFTRGRYGAQRSSNLSYVRVFRENDHMTGTHASPPATSALLSFRARNVRSYWDEVNLSLLGTTLSEEEVARDLPYAGSLSPLSVLPVAGIFGANASGKSTILRAMADMRRIVLKSFRGGDQESKLPRHRFLLLSEGAERPSSFAVDLILNGVRWQYGFEINDHRVVDEYAYHYPKGKQRRVFSRDGGDPGLRFGSAFRSSGRALERLVRKNSLLLSVAGAVADSTRDDRQGVVALIDPLFNWFRRNFALLESDSREERIMYTAKQLEDPKGEAVIVALIQAADLGITKLERLPIDPDPDLVERVKRVVRILSGLEEGSKPGQEVRVTPNDLVRLHHVGTEGPVAIDPQHESQGTLVWVSMLGPVLDSLSRGSVLLVDELDGSLHPHLVERFVRLFQDPKSNPRCAQLIFNAHDPTILGDSRQRLIGRDQIWITEKNAAGATTLYSMAGFHPKSDEALGRRYLQGRYGGVPMLNPAEFDRATEATES